MIGRIAYAALFSVVLPVLLLVWGARMDHLLSLPMVGTPVLGWTVAGIGIGLMLSATRSLWVAGGGLPASPFPPSRFVSSGIYGVFAHPIYLGAVLTTLGVSVATQSAGGLWIVTPTLILATCAWVIGYERDATRARFGEGPAPLFSLPTASEEPPTSRQRLTFYLLIPFQWLIAFKATEWLGPGPDIRSTFVRWDADLPVIPWTESIYFFTYVLVFFAPLVIRSRTELRRYAYDALWASRLIVPMYVIFPFTAEPKAVPGEGFWQSMMQLERDHNALVTALPSFHVVWVCIAAGAWARRFPRLKTPMVVLVLLTIVSCVTTGMHSAADVIAGSFAFMVVSNRERLWSALCRGAERLANSWRELRIGPIRFLNHGVYSAAGVTLAVAVGAALTGTVQLWWLAGMALAAIAGAALWAQLVEGSPQLLRPYGYFGSVVAMALFALLVSALNGDGWLVLGALTVGAAFGQPLGRLRCLVQGCCHGREAHGFPGIRYTHPQSRVVRLSTLGGVPLHPTPLYSLVWTLFVGVALCRLWAVHAHLSLIVGAYLILFGAGRFVEEHFRGEPQTRTVDGLRIYQWLAIAMIVAGGLVMSIASSPAPSAVGFDAATLPTLLALFIIAYVSYGMDFPGSSRRFARLA